MHKTDKVFGRFGPVEFNSLDQGGRTISQSDNCYPDLTHKNDKTPSVLKNGPAVEIQLFFEKNQRFLFIQAKYIL
jgi:hypothetical protein